MMSSDDTVTKHSNGESSTSLDCMTPEVLAQSLFRTKWTFLHKKATIEPVGDCCKTWDGAVDKCCRYLKDVGYDATQMSLRSGRAGEAESGHGQYCWDRSDQKLYCKKCTTHNQSTYRDNNSTFKCTVIAIVSNTKVSDDIYQLELCKLYPHHCRNDVPQKTGVGRWFTTDINFDSIVGTTFDYTLEQLHKVNKDDLDKRQSKNGKFISSMLFIYCSTSFNTYISNRQTKGKALLQDVVKMKIHMIKGYRFPFNTVALKMMKMMTNFNLKLTRILS